MEKRNNPIQVVEIRNVDHRDPVPPGNIEAKVFGDGASPQRRNVLANEAASVLNEFKASLDKWPGVAGVAKVTLKEEALAKSHRPVALFNARSCPIIGTLDFGELLVSVSENGITELQRRILESDSKKRVANISAVSKIEPYSDRERLDGITTQELNDSLRQGNTIKLRLFDHKEHGKNSSIKQALQDFAQSNAIEISFLRYGRSTEVVAIRRAEEDSVEKLTNFIGVRSVKPMPQFVPGDIGTQMSPVCDADIDQCPAPEEDSEYPTVGIFDSGVCPNNTFLGPWIEARESYVPPGQENYKHGTMVAGLIANSRPLNHYNDQFPDTHAKLVDVNIFPDGAPVSEEDIVAAIEATVPKYPHVRVWNLSLGASNPVGKFDFSDFGRFLDEMHDRYDCLFVVAAGNQNNPALWPTLQKGENLNRISSPADSIRSLTVGSITHKDSPRTLVKSGEASPFSRIGPGPCFIPKPEVIHFGGNITATGAFAQTGVLSCGPDNKIFESIGTSFAAPIVSSQAAALFHVLSLNQEDPVPTERVKALLIHSAMLGSQRVTTETIHNYGFGKPGDVLDSLYCDPNCMTLVFETDVKHGGFEFERFPFPIADCLQNDEGKFRGEILMTLVYSPLVDKNFASEYCRTNVDAGMGSYDLDDNGKREFSSQVPVAPKDLKKLYEHMQIANGFKWSPVKAYHRIFPRGIDVDTWRLKMKVTRRAEEDMPDAPQRATLLVSLRGLDPELPVYNEMVQKITQAGWITNDIDQNIRIEGRA